MNIWGYSKTLLLLLFINLSLNSLSAKIFEASAYSTGNVSDTLELNRLRSLVLRNLDTPEEKVYLDSLEMEALKQDDPNSRGFVYRSRVRHYYNKTEYDSAVYHANLATPFLRETGQRDYLVDIESMIVNLHTWRGEYEFALLKGRKLYEESKKINDLFGMTLACENIGFAYSCSKRDRQALHWYRECLSLLDRSEGRETYRMQMEILLTDCFFLLNEVDSAKVHLDRLNELMTFFEGNRDRLRNGETRITEYWVWLYSELAEVEIRRANPEKAKSYLDQAERYMKEGVEEMSQKIFYRIYSNYYMAMGQYREALGMEKRAWDKIPTYEDNMPEQIYRTGKIYEKLGDYKQASTLYRRKLSLADSLSNSRFTRQTSQLNSIYSLDRLEREGKRDRLRVGRLGLTTVSLLVFTLLLLGMTFLFARYKKRLSQVTRAAKEANARTSIFLDNVSREIRRALDDISELSGRLISARDVEERKSIAKMIEEKNGLLQHVIFNILDVSKIDSERMAFNPSEIFLPDVVDEMCGWASRFLPDGVKVRPRPGVALTITADLVRLRQILENLIRFLFSHEVPGEISLGYEGEKDRVRFFVSHATLILGEEERAVLFDRQEQTNRELEDMGLDLVICKLLVTKMGGDLNVSDKTEAGTTFRFTLPFIQLNKEGGEA